MHEIYFAMDVWHLGDKILASTEIQHLGNIGL